MDIALLLLIFGYLLCGLMMVSSVIERDKASKEKAKAIRLQKILTTKVSGDLFLRRRRK